MNSRIASSIAAAALALLGSSAAFAQQAAIGESYDAVPAFVSTQSRAAVKAELLRARAAGEVQLADDYDYPSAVAATAPNSTLTRAEVKAELLAARQRGEPIGLDDRS